MAKEKNQIAEDMNLDMHPERQDFRKMEPEKVAQLRKTVNELIDRSFTEDGHFHPTRRFAVIACDLPIDGTGGLKDGSDVNSAMMGTIPESLLVQIVMEHLIELSEKPVAMATVH